MPLQKALQTAKAANHIAQAADVAFFTKALVWQSHYGLVSSSRFTHTAQQISRL
jgi:hypothetical protein